MSSFFDFISQFFKKSFKKIQNKKIFWQKNIKASLRFTFRKHFLVHDYTSIPGISICKAVDILTVLKERDPSFIEEYELVVESVV